MTNPEKGPRQLIAPHFRGRAVIDRASMDILTDGDRPLEDVVHTVEGLGIEMRQNFHRILPSALLAQRTGNPLGAVEGWKGHEVHGKEGVRYVTGASMTRIVLEALQTHGLLEGMPAVLERPAARCTEEEAEAIFALLQKHDIPGVLSVTEKPNPSIYRARKTLERVIPPPWTVDVVSPDAVMAMHQASAGPPSEAQMAIMSAARLRAPERWKGIVEEGVNISIDMVSEVLHRLRGGKGQKLLVWLAHRKRRDQA